MRDRGALGHPPTWGSARDSGGSLSIPRRDLVRGLGLPTERGPASVHEPAIGTRPVWKLGVSLEDAPSDEIPSMGWLPHVGQLPPIWDLVDHQPARETLRLLSLVEFTDPLNGCPSTERLCDPAYGSHGSLPSSHEPGAARGAHVGPRDHRWRCGGKGLFVRTGPSCRCQRPSSRPPQHQEALGCCQLRRAQQDLARARNDPLHRPGPHAIGGSGRSVEGERSCGVPTMSALASLYASVSGQRRRSTPFRPPSSSAVPGVTHHHHRRAFRPSCRIWWQSMRIPSPAIICATGKKLARLGLKTTAVLRLFKIRRTLRPWWRSECPKREKLAVIFSKTRMMESLKKLPDDIFNQELLHYLTLDNIVKLDLELIKMERLMDGWIPRYTTWRNC